MQLYGQLNPGKPVPGFASILSSLIKNDGISSIYKGVDAAIGRQLVYGTARIGLHRAISDKLVESNNGKPISFAMKTLSGMASGSIAVCIGTPFDIALVRLQSDSMAPLSERKNYKNVFDALTRTASEEGTGALYKGLAPNVLRGMAMNVGMLACYDQAKEMVAKLLGDPMEKGPALTTQIGASCIAVSYFIWLAELVVSHHHFAMSLFLMPLPHFQQQQQQQQKFMVTTNISCRIAKSQTSPFVKK